METVVVTEPVVSVKGSVNAWTTAAAMASAAAPSMRSSMISANSSLPRRAVMPAPPVTAVSRLAAATRSSSPTSFPRVSLTILKSSMSMRSRATIVPLARAWAVACLARSRKRYRLGSPVSGSWRTWYFSSCSSSRCAVTSRRVSTMPPTAGSSRRSLHRTWISR